MKYLQKIKFVNHKQALWEFVIFSFSIGFVILQIVNKYLHLTGDFGSSVDVPSLMTFTVQTNLLVGLYYLFLFMFNLKSEKYYDILSDLKVKGGVVFIISITGICFGLILYPLVFLSPSYKISFLSEFINVGAHFIIPLLVIINFLFSKPKLKNESSLIGKSKKIEIITYWYLYPLFYFALAEIYGAITGDFAYFFLNPNSQINVSLGYYGGVFIWFFGILIFFVPIGLLYIMIINKKISKNKEKNINKSKQKIL